MKQPNHTNKNRFVNFKRLMQHIASIVIRKKFQLPKQLINAFVNNIVQVVKFSSFQINEHPKNNNQIPVTELTEPIA